MCPAANFPGISIWLCLPLSTCKSNVDYRYLIEDFPRDDEAPHQAPSGWSAFHLLFSELSQELKRAKGISLYEIEEESSKLVKFELPCQVFEELENTEPSEKSPLLQEALRSYGIDVPNLVVCGAEIIPSTLQRYDIACNDLRYRINILRETESVSNADMVEVHVLRDCKREIGDRFAAQPVKLLKEWGAHVGPSRTIDVLYRVREKVTDSRCESYAIIGYPILIAEHPSPFAQR